MVKKLDDMNLIDDFLFWTLLSDEVYGPEVARYLLETILRRSVRTVKVHPQRTIYGEDKDLHGVRLDAYIEEDGTDLVSGDLYDIEPDQNSSTKNNLPYRTRFYHAIMDSSCLRAGEDYTELKQTYIIMITPYDPFDRNRMVYTVRNSCVEAPELSYDDGAFTIYLNIGGTADGMPEDLVNLLRYMKNSNRENAIGEPLTEIQKMVEEVKQRKGVRKAYMKFYEYVKYETDEARKKGWEEGLEKGLKEGREEGLTKGREEGLTKGREEGLEKGREEGLEKGLKEGREEERQNTLREKQRADLAQQRIKELEKEIERLKKA